MTNREKKEYLERFRMIQSEIKQLTMEKEMMKELATRISPSYSNMPHSSRKNDKIQSIVEQIIQQEQIINNKVAALVEIKENIEYALDTVEDGILNLLLRYRYFNGWTWEHIADQMHYTYQWINELHRKALKLIVIDINTMI